MIMQFIFYLGIAVNIVGAILLIVYAVKYYNALKTSDKLSVKTDELRSQMRYRRRISIGIMMLGWIIAMIGLWV